MSSPSFRARLLCFLLLGGLISAALVLGARLTPADMPPGAILPEGRIPLGAWLLVPAAVALLALSRLGAGFQLVLLFKGTHALPAAVQALLFAYWGVYWRPVREHLPALIFQLLFAYALDGLLSLARRKRWELSFGPFPIVLSANLFAMFAPAELDASLAMISLALLSKAFLLRDDGKHIFNPSAFGITVVGLFWLGANLPWRGDVSSQLNLAPNMAELILLLGLIVQLRVRTVLLTAGACLGLTLTHGLTRLVHFGPFWPAVLIIITLLATDPATIPKTGPGRALAGLSLGLAMPLAGAAVAAFTGGWDYYGKVLLIPAMNLLAPTFDRLGRWLPAAFDFRFTRWHVAAWFLLAAAAIGFGSKMHRREEELHQSARTPLVRANDDGTVSCARNPVFCRPFTFIDEAKLWLDAR